MATKKRKSKKTEEAPVEVVEAPAQKLDVATVEVAKSPVPPSRRLFPSSLIAELDAIKARLDEIEKKLK
jgi:hypothetical protein